MDILHFIGFFLQLTTYTDKHERTVPSGTVLVFICSSYKTLLFVINWHRYRN